MHWDYFGVLGFGLGWVFLLFFWLLLILGVAYLIKLFRGSARRGENEETPLDILKKRYAKGEISREEFENIKDDLTKM